MGPVMHIKVSTLGRIRVVPVAVSFAETSVSALNPQLGFLTLSDATTKVDSFPLRIEFTGKAPEGVQAIEVMLKAAYAQFRKEKQSGSE